jgi:hypothetical protein
VRIASRSSEDITIIAAEHIVAERTGASMETPVGSCWPRLLHMLRKGHLPARGIIDRYSSNETVMVRHHFIGRVFHEPRMLEAGISPVDVPPGWWLLPSVPTTLMGCFSLFREAGDYFERLREITVKRADIDRLLPPFRAPEERIKSLVASGTICRNQLVEMMRRDPNNPISKAELRKSFPALSEKAFDRAFTAATGEAPAPKWACPGRRKSPPPNRRP